MMASILRLRFAAPIALILASMLPTTLESQRSIAMRYAFDPRGSVRVFNMVGSVRVIGSQVDSLIITGTVGAGSDFYGGADTQRRGAKFGVELPAGGDAAPTHLEVRVPAGSRIWIKTSSADVSVAGVTGGVDIYAVGGMVRVSAERGTPRELNVETMDGSIEISGAPAWLRAKSASGAIALRGASDDLALSSVSGPISVHGEQGRFGRARLETVTGDIRFAGEIERGGAATFDSHSGRIELVLLPSASVDIDVTTIQGAITNKLNSRKPLIGRERRGQELSFAIGGGGAHITIRSFKGPVVLTSKS